MNFVQVLLHRHQIAAQPYQVEGQSIKSPFAIAIQNLKKDHTRRDVGQVLSPEFVAKHIDRMVTANQIGALAQFLVSLPTASHSLAKLEAETVRKINAQSDTYNAANIFICISEFRPDLLGDFQDAVLKGAASRLSRDALIEAHKAFSEYPEKLLVLKETAAQIGIFARGRETMPLDGQDCRYDVSILVNDKRLTVFAGCHRYEPWARLQAHWLGSPRSVTSDRIGFYIPAVTGLMEDALKSPFVEEKTKALVRNELEAGQKQRTDYGVFDVDKAATEPGIQVGPFKVVYNSLAMRAIGPFARLRGLEITP